MRPSERALSRTLRSRAGAYILCAVAVLCVLLEKSLAILPPISTGRGLVTGGAGADFLGTGTSFVIALFLTLAIMGGMVFINNTFNLLRTSSLLYLGVFAMLEAASPILTIRACSGLAMAGAVLVCVALMCSVYQQPRTCSQRVFLVFAILSAVSMIQYAAVAYIPIFMVACVQMRCFTSKTFPVMLCGIFVPWWIGWGFGWITLADVAFPSKLSVFSHLDLADTVQLAVVTAITVVAGFTLTLTNVVKIYSYNARSRAFTGLLATLTFATLLFTMIDVANVTAYLPLLNCCVAYQAALSFLINYERRGYLTPVILAVVCLGMAIWSISL